MPAQTPPVPQPAAPRRADASLAWVAGLGAAFLLIRATTTLLAGASWETPGDGWRSLWQLAIVALLGYGLVRPAALRSCVAVVGVVYLASTLSELVNPDDLLGVIPVDMRDRIVHPALALLAVGALWLTGERGREQAQPAA